MDEEKLLKEYEIELSIQKIISEINDKIKLYEETKDIEIKSELIQLIKDRDLVYSNDKKTIEKYLKNRSE